MSTLLVDELKKTNANLRVMMNMQKMIIDALLSKAKPSKEEAKAFKDDEFVSLDELKKELRKG